MFWMLICNRFWLLAFLSFVFGLCWIIRHIFSGSISNNVVPGWYERCLVISRSFTLRCFPCVFVSWKIFIDFFECFTLSLLAALFFRVRPWFPFLCRYRFNRFCNLFYWSDCNYLWVSWPEWWQLWIFVLVFVFEFKKCLKAAEVAVFPISSMLVWVDFRVSL